MDRRTVLSAGGAALGAALAGCLGDDDDDDSSEADPTPTATPSPDVEYNQGLDTVLLTNCELDYIESEVFDDDQSLQDDPVPSIVRQEIRDDGEFAEVLTEATAVGPDDETEEYTVRAFYYVVDNEEHYRTEDPDVDPSEGEAIDC